MIGEAAKLIEHLASSPAASTISYNLQIIIGVFGAMLRGYDLVYVAIIDAPFWIYKFGRSPVVNHPSGTIPKGGEVYLHRPPDTLGTHQSAYLDGVGRIIVRIGDFESTGAFRFAV